MENEVKIGAMRVITKQLQTAQRYLLSAAVGFIELSQATIDSDDALSEWAEWKSYETVEYVVQIMHDTRRVRSSIKEYLNGKEKSEAEDVQEDGKAEDSEVTDAAAIQTHRL